MIIETKFDIGDTAWMMKSNQCIEVEIKSFSIVGEPSGLYNSVIPHIDYSARYEQDDDVWYNLSGNDLFKTKQELIDSL
jgi:hypothetical protein